MKIMEGFYMAFVLTFALHELNHILILLAFFGEIGLASSAFVKVFPFNEYESYYH